MTQGRRVIQVPVVRAARFVLAHVPGLVVLGSKPRRELDREGEALRAQLRAHLRSFHDAVAYFPHQLLIGNEVPEALYEIPRPWHGQPTDNARASGAEGLIVDQDTFYAWLARADTADLVVLEAAYAARIAAGLNGVRVITRDAAGLALAVASGAEPFYDDSANKAIRVAGVVLPGDEADESLQAPVLLENLAAKVTGALALRPLFDEVARPPGRGLSDSRGCAGRYGDRRRGRRWAQPRTPPRCRCGPPDRRRRGGTSHVRRAGTSAAAHARSASLGRGQVRRGTAQSRHHRAGGLGRHSSQ